jgi:hypothetical protein
MFYKHALQDMALLLAHEAVRCDMANDASNAFDWLSAGIAENCRRGQGRHRRRRDSKRVAFGQSAEQRRIQNLLKKAQVRVRNGIKLTNTQITVMY